LILLADVNYINKQLKELEMVIYQTLDEQDYPVNDYLDLIVAVQIEDDLRHFNLVNDDEEEDISEWIGAA
jgi:hypothetical protein